MSTLLLSDLHLPPRPSSLRTVFTQFLKGPARTAQAVYILGDLFEVWSGDAEGLEDYAAEAQALRELTADVPVFFMHGNRDFLLGAAFAKATGVRMLHDPVVVELEGQRTLLSHGDVFCTDDIGYQRWRRWSRLKLLQRCYFALPRHLRQAVVSRVRATSLVQKRSKADDITDVNDQAIVDAFRRYRVQRLVHGHTHRPAEHRHRVDGQSCERIVLADWRPDRCEVLSMDAGTMSRLNLAEPA